MKRNNNPLMSPGRTSEVKPVNRIFGRGTAIAVALTCVIAAGAFSAPPKVEPLNVQPANPVTLEDKIAAAEVIALGRVDSVAPLKKDENSYGRSTRQPYTAIIRVEKIYKGNPGEGKISALFIRTENETRPALVTFSTGERAVFFLRTSETAGYLETITPFTGKERPDYDLLKKLEKASGQDGLKGGVEATLTLDTPPTQAGAPIVISFRIDNKGGLPVLFNSTPSPSLDISISDPAGKTINASSSSRDTKAMSTQLRLIPGAYYGYSADVSKLFALKAPGKYTLYATFKPSAGRDQTAWSGAIRANSVSFEIPKSK